MRRSLLFLALLLILPAVPALAEFQISGYGGMNSSFDSQVKLDKAGTSETRNVGWKGRSFDAPYYYGARAAYWFEDYKEGWGVAIDFVHAKAYGDINFNTDPVYGKLEFTHGLNLLIFTPMYRFAGWFGGRLVPYVGAGLGVAIPHVEVITKINPSETGAYEVVGLAAHALAGVEYRFTHHISTFLEAKMSYADINASLKGGGGIGTSIWSPQWLMGISYRFGL